MIDEILSRYDKNPENILFALHDIQDSKEKKYLEFDELKAVAKYFNVPLSKVKGVATFYSMYSVKPRGKYIIRVCESAPCHVKGALDIIKIFKEKLGIEKVGETTEDGLFTLETTSCLGVCGVAPVCMINDEIYGNLTEEKIENLIKEYKNKK